MERIKQKIAELRELIHKEADPSAINPLWVLDEIEKLLK